MRYTIITNPANYETSCEEVIGLIAAEAYLNRDDGETRFTQLVSSAASKVYAKICDDHFSHRYREEDADNVLRILQQTIDISQACLERSGDEPREVVTLAEAVEMVNRLSLATTSEIR